MSRMMGPVLPPAFVKRMAEAYGAVEGQKLTRSIASEPEVSSVRINARRVMGTRLPLRELPSGGQVLTFAARTSAAQFVAQRFARNTAFTRAHRTAQVNGKRFNTPHAKSKPSAVDADANRTPLAFTPVPWNERWGVYLPSAAYPATDAEGRPLLSSSTSSALPPPTDPALSHGRRSRPALAKATVAPTAADGNAATAPVTTALAVAAPVSTFPSDPPLAMALHSDPLHTAAGLYYSQDAASQVLASMIDSDTDPNLRSLLHPTASPAGTSAGASENAYMLTGSELATDADVASAAAASVSAGPARALRVLDLCAAPGGKTTLLASTLPAGSLVIANEIDRNRARALAENVTRHAAIPGVAVIVTNANVEHFTARQALTDAPAADATTTRGPAGGRIPHSSLALLRAHPPRQAEVGSPVTASTSDHARSSSSSNSSNSSGGYLAGSAALISSVPMSGPLAAAGISTDAPALRRYPRGSTALSLPGAPVATDTIPVAPLTASNPWGGDDGGLSGGGYHLRLPPAAALGERPGFESFFDLVLLDAPCSGSAMFRREPAAVRAWTPGMPRERAATQHRLVSAALPLAQRLGGRLLYMTCSLDPVENQHVVARAHKAAAARNATLRSAFGDRSAGDGLRGGDSASSAAAAFRGGADAGLLGCPEPIPLGRTHAAPSPTATSANASDRASPTVSAACAWSGPEPPLGSALAGLPVAPLSPHVVAGAGADLLPLDFPTLKRGAGAWGLVESSLSVQSDDGTGGAGATAAAAALLPASAAAPALGPVAGADAAAAAAGLREASQVPAVLSALSTSSADPHALSTAAAASLSRALWLHHATYLGLPSRARLEGSYAAGFVRGDRAQVAAAAVAALEARSPAVSAALAATAGPEEALWRLRAAATPQSSFRPSALSEVTAAAVAATEARADPRRATQVRLAASATARALLLGTGTGADQLAAQVSGSDSSISSSNGYPHQRSHRGGDGAGEVTEAEVLPVAGSEGPAAGEGRRTRTVIGGAEEAARYGPDSIDGDDGGGPGGYASSGNSAGSSFPDDDGSSNGPRFGTGTGTEDEVWLGLGPGARVGGFIRASPALTRALSSWVRLPSRHCLLLRVRADSDFTEAAAARGAAGDVAHARALGAVPAAFAVKSNAGAPVSARKQRARDRASSSLSTLSPQQQQHGGDGGALSGAAEWSAVYSPLRAGAFARRLDEDGSFAAEVLVFPETHLPVLQWLSSRVLTSHTGNGAGSSNSNSAGGADAFTAPVRILSAGVPVGTLRFVLPPVAAGLLEDAAGAAAGTAPHGSPALSSPRAGVRVPLSAARFTPSHALALAAADLLPPRRLRKVVSLSEAEAVAFTTADGTVPMWLFAGAEAAAAEAAGATPAEAAAAAGLGRLYADTCEHPTSVIVPPAPGDLGVPLRARPDAPGAGAGTGTGAGVEDLGWILAQPLAEASPRSSNSSGEIRLAVSPEGVPIGWLQWRRAQRGDATAGKKAAASERRWHSLFPRKWRLVKVQPFGGVSHSAQEFEVSEN